MNSERDLKVYVGDIVALDKNISFNALGKYLVDSNHMFYVSKVSDTRIRIHVVSSNMNHVSDKYPSNSPILDWRKAGLSKPSYINGNSNGWVDISYVYRKIGSLTSRDFKSAMDAIRHRTFVNQKIESHIDPGFYFYL